MSALRLLAVAALTLLAACPGTLGTPVEPVEKWSAIEIILSELEDAVGTQDEIAAAYAALDDLDGDGLFSLDALQFLIEPADWAPEFENPVDLYDHLVQIDDSLTVNGRAARVLAADRIEKSLEELLAE